MAVLGGAAATVYVVAISAMSLLLLGFTVPGFFARRLSAPAGQSGAPAVV